ncbi:TnsA-like heteromeric transposase endonuclease subunit [Microbacterium sp. YJN-G]|uniref:TnsA-like heteromeric transposase endonuclease subunit n=1 Tax=Microbacterium sp. YJN-G TaxID=2763257 RepID=UPI0018783588|nr:TnsA-like heteromeric transposase endonuclease subunit [Microbacterium sp. YJN-G]
MARVEIEWVASGRRDRRSAVDVAGVLFEVTDRVRQPESWKHKKNYEGFYWAATTGRHVWFESLYERAALMRFDRDRRVLAIASQPMTVHWGVGARWHVPDFFVRYRDGRGVVVDVKPAKRIDERDVETFRWTAALCEGLGWGYQVVSDISTMEDRNLRFLSGYRYDRWVSTGADVCLGAHVGEERTLQDWASELNDACPEPLGAVYSAAWWRRLQVDPDDRLSLRSMARAV